MPYPIKPLFFSERIGFRGRTKSCGQGVLVGFLKASTRRRETSRDRTTAAVVKGAGETARPLAGTRRRTPTMQPLLHRFPHRTPRGTLSGGCSVSCKGRAWLARALWPGRVDLSSEDSVNLNAVLGKTVIHMKSG